MKLSGTVRGLRSASLMAATGLMLTLWLSVMVLSISPSLHRLLHRDAQNSHHDCLVTHFVKSQVLSGASVAVVPAVDCASFVAPFVFALPFVSQPENRLSPSRAPPALSSPQIG